MKNLFKLIMIGCCVMSLVGCASGRPMTQNETNATVTGTVVGVSLGMLGGAIVSGII